MKDLSLVRLRHVSRSLGQLLERRHPVCRASIFQHLFLLCCVCPSVHTDILPDTWSCKKSVHDSFHICDPSALAVCWVSPQHFFICIETENRSRHLQRGKGTDWMSLPKQRLCPSIPLWAAPHLSDPQGTQKTCEREEQSNRLMKSLLCVLGPPSWALVNTICLNNDQSIIDMMRLPGARPFSSAWLTGKWRKKEKPTLMWPWHTSLGSDFSKLRFELESPDLSVLRNKEAGR